MSPFGRSSAAHSELTYSLLSGLRIIEISAFIAAPLAGLTLAQLGAEVIRIDPVGGGMDRDRWPVENGKSLYWSGLNRAKKSVCLDLKTAEGQAVLHGLLRTGGSGGGIVLTNLTGPDWLEFDRLCEVRSDLIMVDLKGHHDGGAAVDYTVNAAVGIPFATGPENTEGPVNHMLPAWDAVAGLSLATAVLAALHARGQSGNGQHLSVALSDVAYAFLGNTGLIAETELSGTDRPRIGNHIYGAFGQDLPSRDGRHVMVAAITGGQWRALVKATGMGEELSRLEERTGFDFSTDAGRFEGREAIADLFRRWSVKLDFDELMSILRQISMDLPRPIVELRGDVDPVIQELCLKMLAKDVFDRPGAMQGVAQQLSDWIEGRRVAHGEAATLALPSNPGPPPMSEIVGNSDKQPETTSDSQARPAESDSVNSGGNRKLLLSGGLGGVVLLLAGLTFFFRLGKYDVQVTLGDPNISLSVDEGALVISGTDSDTIRLTDGPHKLKAEIGDFTAELDEFTVKKDGKNAVYVAIVEDKLVIYPTGKAAVPNIPPTNTQPLRTPLPDSAWVEVLSQVDPEADCRSGSVTPIERGYQFKTPMVDKDWATLAIPVELSGHYRVQLHVTPGTSHGIHAILPVENRLVCVMISHGKVSLNRIDDMHIGVQSLLPEGMRGFRGEIEVRPFDDQLQVIIRADGDTILDWSGRQEQLRQIPMGGMVRERDKTALCVWGQEPGHTYDVHDFQICAVDGVAKLLQPRDGAKQIGSERIISKPAPPVSTGHGNSGYALQFGSGSKLPWTSFRTGSGVTISPLKIGSNQDFTIEFWVRAKGNNGQLFFLATPYRMFVQSGKSGFAYYGGAEDPLNLQVPGEPVEDWIHVAGVFEGNELRHYAGGRLQGTARVANRAEMSSSSMEIGRDTHAEIDEVRISSVARYDEDFTPATRFIPDADTVGLYHFDEGTGLEVKDSSGNNHHGTITLHKTTDAPQAVWVKADGPTAGGNTPPLAVAPFDEAQAKAHQEAWAKHLGEPVVTTTSLGMKLAVIPPGEFTMGSPANEPGRRSEEGQVAVTLSQPFRLGIHEVTQGQWTAIMETEPWKGQKNVQPGEDVAATYVSWYDVTKFCRRLTERERSTGKIGKDEEYRLPTEAELGFACRAGTQTAYWYGDRQSQLGDYAWYDLNARNAGEAYAHEVGLKKPNPWNLYDVHGNVNEWCRDWHGYVLPGGKDPVGPLEGSLRVNRGGSWYFTAGYCRSAFRSKVGPSSQASDLGFRLALSLSGESLGEPVVGSPGS